MLFSDLLGALLSRPGQFAMPGAEGPFGLAPALPKAASNATGGSIPGVRGPAMANPAEMLNASTAANSAQYENTLKELQGKKLQQQIGLAGDLGPLIKAMLAGGNDAGTGQAGSATADLFGSLAPKAPASGGVGGSGGPGRVSLAEARAAAERAGFKGDAADIAAATGMAESSGNLNATNEKGEHSYGYMQINQDAHGPVAKETLGNLDRAMQVAFKVSNGGTDFSPWTMYRNGQYRQYLGGGAQPFSLAGGMGGGQGQPVQLAQNGPMAPGSLAGGAAAPLALGGASPQAGVSPGQMSPGGGMDLGALRQFLSQDPRMTAKQRQILGLGMGAQLAGLPDIAAPFERMYQNSPEMAGKKALQEKLAEYFSPNFNPALRGQIKGQEEWAGVDPANAKKQFETNESIRAAGPIARGQQQEKIEIGRPGGVVFQGTQAVNAIPQIEKVTDPVTGMETYRYLTPPINRQASNAGTAPAPGGLASPPPNPAAPGTQAAAPAVPGAPVADTGLGVAKLGPGQTKALETRAEKEQADRQKVIEDANSAQQSRATLMNMAAETGKFVQGPFSQHYQEAMRYLRLMNPNADEQVPSYEAFVKNAGALTRQAVHDVSARAAVQEFNQIQRSLPSPEMSPQGLQKIQNEMIGLTDYRIAKAQAQQQWEQKNGGVGNVSGFETAFQKLASPYAFIVARMDHADVAELRDKLKSNPQGQKELALLQQQLQYLKQSGLAQ